MLVADGPKKSSSRGGSVRVRVERAVVVPVDPEAFVLRFLPGPVAVAVVDGFAFAGAGAGVDTAGFGLLCCSPDDRERSLKISIDCG